MKPLLASAILALASSLLASGLDSYWGLEVEAPDRISYILSINNDSGRPIDVQALSEEIDKRFRSAGIEPTQIKRAPEAPFLHIIVTAFPQVFNAVLSFHRPVEFQSSGKTYQIKAKTWSDGVMGMNPTQALVTRAVLNYISAFLGVFEQANQENQSPEMTCKKSTRAFLHSQYLDDPEIARKFMRPEFASLWVKACTPPEGEVIYWGADPIMETQDTDPSLLSLGPANADGGIVNVPVVFQHKGKPPYTKTFVFQRAKESWMISDIRTTGLREGPESEFEKLRKDL
jgi:hypothetical protein